MMSRDIHDVKYEIQNREWLSEEEDIFRRMLFTDAVEHFADMLCFKPVEFPPHSFICMRRWYRTCKQIESAKRWAPFMKEIFADLSESLEGNLSLYQALKAKDSVKVPSSIKFPVTED